ncbi:peptidase, partial [Streptomyces solincola]
MFAAFSVPRRRSGRPGRRTTAAVVSGLVAAAALAAGTPAAADEAAPRQHGAAATLGGLTTYDRAVLRIAGETHEIPAGLFEMAVDGGGTLKTYCVDLHNPSQENARYQETSWDRTSLAVNQDAGRVRWILQHSYPQVDDLAGLARKARSGPLSAETAAAGTQVAIWRHTDDARVEAADPAAEKLADWLEKQARDVPEPTVSLGLAPEAAAGPAGSRIGPFTVRTGADRVSVALGADAAPGLRVTDQAGKPVTEAADGSALYVDVPAGTPAGSTSLTVQAATPVPVGRAFTAVTRSQTQILAGSSESTVTATATASWAAQGAAAPAVTARENCAEQGVDITAVNRGGAPFAYELAGGRYVLPPGESRTVTVPVAEDQPYEITVEEVEGAEGGGGGEGAGGAAKADGFSRTFTGGLDCRTTGGAAAEITTQQAGQPSPFPAGGAGPPAGPQAAGDGVDLAETGASGATPAIAGIAPEAPVSA